MKPSLTKISGIRVNLRLVFFSEVHVIPTRLLRCYPACQLRATTSHCPTWYNS